MFFDISSPENIYIKEYKYPDLAHGYDSYNIPRQLMGGNGYSSGNAPTLDLYTWASLAIHVYEERSSSVTSLAFSNFVNPYFGYI